MLRSLPLFQIPVGELLQHVSRTERRGRELHYGRSGANRYDDPARKYGVIYFGCDLNTALMETVFHKHQWFNAIRRSIAKNEIEDRIVRATGIIKPVFLADLTASGVMAGCFGLNLEQLSSRDYVHTQRVSAQVHELCRDGGEPMFDGVLYPSRNNFPSKAIALFERASDKIRVFEDIDLVEHVAWPDFVSTYGIGIEPDPGKAEPEDC